VADEDLTKYNRPIIVDDLAFGWGRAYYELPKRGGEDV
jgi:hypothetical protein